MISVGNSAASFRFNVGPFFQEWSAIKRRSRDAGRFYVRTQAKRLVRVVAYHTPYARRGYYRGRARAGWWPAALALGVSSVYTIAPNKGEGRVQDMSQSVTNPTITIVNAVPYITVITGQGLDWFNKAIEQMRGEMRSYLDKAWAKALYG